MNWLNIPTNTIHTPEYVGSEPVERATWLNLMAYCAEQENGGTIPACRGWKCRRWQQTCGVTADEVNQSCDLWTFDEDGNLTVWGYPKTKETEVQAKREGGSKGGKKRAENAAQSTASGQLASSASSIASRTPSTEGKGREWNGKEGNGREDAPPPALVIADANINPNRMATFDQVMAFARSQPMAITEECCEAFYDRMESEGWITKNGHPLNDWKPRFRQWVTAWVNNGNGRRTA